MHLTVTQCTLLLAFVTTHILLQPAAATAAESTWVEKLDPQYTMLKMDFIGGASLELTDSSDPLTISAQMSALDGAQISGTSSWQLGGLSVDSGEWKSVTLHPGIYTNLLTYLPFIVRSAEKLPGPDHVPSDMLEMIAIGGNGAVFYLLDSTPEVLPSGPQIKINVLGNSEWNVYNLVQYNGDYEFVQPGTSSTIGTPSFRLNGYFSALKLVPVETVEPTQPAQNGGWTTWEAWSECMNECGFMEFRTRWRTCDNPMPDFGGLDCPGDSTQDEECPGTGPCPVDGGWSTWEAWSQCQAQCESKGTRTRTRSCNNPAPEYGGLDCQESASQEEVCTSTERCPVNGGWSTWAAWSQCQAQCESNGTRTRTRSCNNPAPEYRGLDCSDSASQQEGCTNTLRCDNPARCQSAPTGYLPDPLDSTWFYQCQDIGGGEYIIHHMPCGPGTEWTALSQQTIRCYHISTTTTSTVTASSNAIECPKLGVKYFHDPTNKHKHYQCVHGTKYHRDCQPGLCVPKTYTGGPTHPCTQRCDNMEPLG